MDLHGTAVAGDVAALATLGQRQVLNLCYAAAWGRVDALRCAPLSLLAARSSGGVVSTPQVIRYIHVPTCTKGGGREEKTAAANGPR